MVTDRLPPGTFVVVSGPPASGKTTLSPAIAPALGLPLIAKDTIKQALMTVLPVPDVAASRVVGRASVAALLAVAAESGGAVLESVWHRSYALDDLRRLPGQGGRGVLPLRPCARGGAVHVAGRVQGRRSLRRRTGDGRAVERRGGPAGGRGLAGDRGRHGFAG